jgi:hypothetical protein
MYQPRTIILAAMSLTLSALALCQANSSKTAPPATPTVPPISYFEDRCARCHGPQGSFYGDDFGRKLSEDALQKVVDDMCRVQGDAPLKGLELEAQVAYHRAMIAKEPFLVVTRTKDGELAGEVAEKAVVSVKYRRISVTAEVKATSWKSRVPKGEKPEDAVITATLGKRTSVVRLSKESFSHSRPIKPAPEEKPAAP